MQVFLKVFIMTMKKGFIIFGFISQLTTLAKNTWLLIVETAYYLKFILLFSIVGTFQEEGYVTMVLHGIKS